MRVQSIAYRVLVTLTLLEVFGHGLPSTADTPVQRDAQPFHLELVRVPLIDLCRVLERRSGIPHTVADTATGDLPVTTLGAMSPAELREAAGEALCEMVSLPPAQMLAVPWTASVPPDLVAQHRDLLLWWKELPDASRRRLTAGGLSLRDVPVGAKPRTMTLLADVLRSTAPLTLSGARMQVEASDDVFQLIVRGRDPAPVNRRLHLVCRPDLVTKLRREEDARLAALNAAMGIAALEGGDR